ncbi:restriction endonuclease subunit S [Staphylococcus hominis]|uniref:restriction endonuclease subunit S n=1 Tax=Staphylococcus hominis TaxID=1290 RepID=UPI000C7BAD39|nr:restriction endonuclease subunit S [Staphylococcus hominis]MCI2894554.1 restriction endonuclease subunit S [Staphylococcus hominis]MCI2903125.1 restriction endonuclease subunit S [Staphylococcus hominis]MCI2905474.1 restriction endonuclease subunit S [Staphylococcus hominis]MCI2912068.1 restriction endonuclease subunit S [Staphylococcus hominis]MCI2921270.1 restriction endonuclease subunit S [Staphylococcus hominis]
MEYKEILLKDLASKIGDGLHGTPSYDPKGDFYFVNGNNLEEGNIVIKDTTKTVNRETFEKYKKDLSKRTLLVSINGTIGKIAKFNNENIVLGKSACYINLNDTADKNYIYFLLKSREFQNYIQQYATGTTIKNVSLKTIRNFKVKLPALKYQNRVSTILQNIENKIQLNYKMIANLEELSQTLFKRWFIDFEFPDRNGAPYKSSGGEMIDSELGEIPKNWSIKTVKETAESFNSIRKPLSKLEREKRESIYPYYGATKIIDYVDNYIFDGKYILVGEDGTVQTEAGNPFIQYVWGKFWVSNHAHILKGKLISDELLMLYLKNTNVAPYITGAVQPKLNKKNLNSIKFVIADKETIIKFENFIKSYFQKIRILNKENKKLIELRDTLLSKFMSGEIEIPDDIEVNTDELSI